MRESHRYHHWRSFSIPKPKMMKKQTLRPRRWWRWRRRRKEQIAKGDVGGVYPMTRTGIAIARARRIAGRASPPRGAKTTMVLLDGFVAKKQNGA